MALSEKTRQILGDERGGINSFISGLSIPTVAIWYSAIDGEIYSKGPRNPAAIDPRYQDSDIRCLVLKADMRGRPLPEVIGNTDLEEIDREIEGHPINTVIRRVLEQVREYREGLESAKIKRK